MDPETLNEFARLLLIELGYTPAEPNIALIREWARWEGTGAQWNPLATTQPGEEDPANPYWNTFGDENQYHVRNYATWAAGIAQTVRTLRNGRYPRILASLQAGVWFYDAAPEMRTWGTTGLANIIEGQGAVQRSHRRDAGRAAYRLLEDSGIIEWVEAGNEPLKACIDKLQDAIAALQHPETA